MSCILKVGGGRYNRVLLGQRSTWTHFRLNGMDPSGTETWEPGTSSTSTPEAGKLIETMPAPAFYKLGGKRGELAELVEP